MTGARCFTIALASAAIVLSASVASSAGTLVVLSDLPPPARAIVASRVRDLGLADTVDVRIVEPGDVSSALARAPGPTLIVGLPLAALAPSLDRCVAIGELPATAPAELCVPDRRALSLWFDPMRLAAASLSDELDGARVLDRPIGLAELTRGAFEDRLILAEPQPWNVSGQLLATLAFTAETAGAGDRLLTGLDANVVLPYLGDDGIALSRLLAAPPSNVAVVTRSTLAREAREPGASSAFQSVRGVGGPVVVLRGAAVHGVDAATAEGWLRAFDHETVRAIAAAADLVPLAVTVESKAGDAEEEADRVLIGANAAAVLRAQLEAEPVLRRFKTDLKGSLARRAERFSEVFDTVGMIAIVAVVAAALLARRREAKRRSAASGEPE